MAWKCFWVGPTQETAVWLRRYDLSDNRSKCPSPENHGYHCAFNRIENGVIKDAYDHTGIPSPEQKLDPRWPAKCSCGYQFRPEDEYQIFSRTIHIRYDTGERFELKHLHELPIGAMFHQFWWPGDNWYMDGLWPAVVLPGKHIWSIDAIANNCTDRYRPHKCWVRHGVAPNFTVDKYPDPGYPPSCNAGAGSILVPSWHGFLKNGLLTTNQNGQPD